MQMKHFFSPAGKLFGYLADGSQDELIPADYVPVTDAQLEALRNPPPVPLTTAQQLQLLDQQNALTQRNLREAIMLLATAVTASNPAADLTKIPGVAKVFEVEAQAAALRAQL